MDQNAVVVVGRRSTFGALTLNKVNEFSPPPCLLLRQEPPSFGVDFELGPFLCGTQKPRGRAGLKFWGEN